MPTSRGSSVFAMAQDSPSKQAAGTSADVRAGAPQPSLSLEAAIRSVKSPTPPPLLPSASAQPIAKVSANEDEGQDAGDVDAGMPPPTKRRVAKRRPAGPVRNKIAANDDAPSIGGLIYALEQKPSAKVFRLATIASIAWGVLGSVYAYLSISASLPAGSGFFGFLLQPSFFYAVGAIGVPIAVVWLLALLSYHVAALTLKSSTMTEVAIRLAEPDRMAEQSIASLGQAVRRQVSFMNDAVSRAIGRASELEAMVHHEVNQLDRSYEENEKKIRGLIRELSGERFELLNTSERVTENLRTLGREVPELIERLSQQQMTLADIIKGAGENLISLESSLATNTGRLENVLSGGKGQLENLLQDYTEAFGVALSARAENIRSSFEGYMQTLDTSLGNRTENLQTVFEEYAKALDTTLANRTDALDMQLIERTKSLDAAFSERLRNFDDRLMQSSLLIDSTINEKTAMLTAALENHARTFKETIGKQASDLDDSVMHGISAVHRASENITRQSLKAIEGLASQSDLLKNVSENLLAQISGVTHRFETQGQSVLKAANALEAANYKIDATLQTRHSDLSKTLDKLSGKADEFGRFVTGYSSSIEGSISDAERRARATAEQLRAETENRSRLLLEDLEKIRNTTESHSERALADLRNRFEGVSSEVRSQLGTLSTQFTETSEDVRRKAAEAAKALEFEQRRLREEAARIPATARETAEAMRRSLQDQLTALDQLSQLANRQAASRDVVRPEMQAIAGPNPAAQQPGRAPTASLTASLAQEVAARQQRQSGPATGAGDPRDGWSLGDLLARASREDERATPPTIPPPAGGQGGEGFALNPDLLARAIDPMTAGAVWNRMRSGQKGVMVRSIYSQEGRAAFDEITRRLATEGELQRTVAQYLADFERSLADADARDPSGRLSYSQLVSDTGRVYLFLAHAAGRLG